MSILQLHPGQLAQWPQQLPAGSQVLLLDVREGWELELAHAQHHTQFKHLHIPLFMLPHRWQELDSLLREQPHTVLACLCHHGARSMQAAYFLQRQGVGPLANIVGGVDAWAQFDPQIGVY